MKCHSIEIGGDGVALSPLPGCDASVSQPPHSACPPTRRSTSAACPNRPPAAAFAPPSGEFKPVPVRQYLAYTVTPPGLGWISIPHSSTCACVRTCPHIVFTYTHTRSYLHTNCVFKSHTHTHTLTHVSDENRIPHVKRPCNARKHVSIHARQ